MSSSYMNKLNFSQKISAFTIVLLNMKSFIFDFLYFLFLFLFFSIFKPLLWTIRPCSFKKFYRFVYPLFLKYNYTILLNSFLFTGIPKNMCSSRKQSVRHVDRKRGSKHIEENIRIFMSQN